MTINDYSNWKIAMKRSGNPASLQSTVARVSKCNHLFTQIPPVEVEFSELPSIDPLTLEHMLGVYLIYSVLIVLSILAWLTEVCVNSVQRRKEGVGKIGRIENIQAQESKPSASAQPNPTRAISNMAGKN